MSITLTDARRIVRTFLRFASSPTSYPDAQIDYAIKTCGNEFIRRTMANRTTGTLALSSGTATLPAFPTGFRPDRLLSAFFSSGIVVDSETETFSPYFTEGALELGGLGENRQSELRVISAPQIYDRQGASTLTGQPTAIAFDTLTTGLVSPTPDQSYTLKILYDAVFTDWTDGCHGTYSSTITYYVGDVVEVSGTLYRCIQQALAQAPASSAAYWTSMGTGTGTTSDSVTFNLADDQMQMVLVKGVTSILQAPEPDMGYVRDAAAAWEAYIQSCIGSNGLGTKEVRQLARGRR